MNPQRQWQHAQDLWGSSQISLQHWGGSRQSIPPQPRNYLKLIPTGKGKVSFYSSQLNYWFIYLISVDGTHGEVRGQLSRVYSTNVTGNINHTPVKALCPAVIGQHNMNLMVFWWTFCLHFLSYWSFVYLDFNFVFFKYVSCFVFVSCFLWKRQKRKWNWVSGKDLWKGKQDQNIFYRNYAK